MLGSHKRLLQIIFRSPNHSLLPFSLSFHHKAAKPEKLPWATTLPPNETVIKWVVCKVDVDYVFLGGRGGVYVQS